jgi:hypothetical protein
MEKDQAAAAAVPVYQSGAEVRTLISIIVLISASSFLL